MKKRLGKGNGETDHEGSVCITKGITTKCKETSRQVKRSKKKEKDENGTY